MPDFNHIATQADIDALYNADVTTENMMRDLGRHAEADQLKVTREARVREWRTGAGMPAEKPTVDPEVIRAADFSISLDAKPGDYAAAELRKFAEGKDEQRVNQAKGELGDLAAAMKLDPVTGRILIEFIAAEGPRTGALDQAGRENYVAENDRQLVAFARSRGTTPQAMKDSAKKMLEQSGQPLGRDVASSVLLSSPTLVLELWNHAQAMKAFKGK